MNGFKGTKGKWIHRQFPEGQNSVRTIDDTRRICVPRVYNRDESDANMLLISKAPEMLEILEKLQLVLGGYFQMPDKETAKVWSEEIKQLIKEATEL